MYARVIPIQCRPGLLTDFLSVYRSAVLPPLVREPGFHGALVLSDPEIHTGFIVTLWNSEAALAQSELKSRKAVAAMLLPFLTAHPQPEQYEVLVRAGQHIGGLFARMITLPVPEAQLEPARAVYEQEYLPILRQQPGFQGRAVAGQSRARHRTRAELLDQPGTDAGRRPGERIFPPGPVPAGGIFLRSDRARLLRRFRADVTAIENQPSRCLALRSCSRVLPVSQKKTADSRPGADRDAEQGVANRVRRPDQIVEDADRLRAGTQADHRQDKDKDRRGRCPHGRRSQVLHNRAGRSQPHRAKDVRREEA